MSLPHTTTRRSRRAGFRLDRDRAFNSRGDLQSFLSVQSSLSDGCFCIPLSLIRSLKRQCHVTRLREGMEAGSFCKPIGINGLMETPNGTPAKHPRIIQTLRDAARHMLNNNSLQKNGNGQVIGVVAVTYDVGERKLAEVKQRADGGPVECEARPIAVQERNATCSKKLFSVGNSPW